MTNATTISPLRQRMIEDMTARGLGRQTQRGHILACKRFAAYLKRSRKAVLYDILFKASAEATLTIAADARRLGARIGITSVLHTWGSAMTHHPHVHMIVPGGGLSEDRTKWIACRPDFFLPVRVLSRLFRRLVLAMLLDAYEEGRLRFFAEHAELAERQAFAAFLRPLKHSEWVVYAKRTLRRAGGGARLSLALHAPCRHL